MLTKVVLSLAEIAASAWVGNVTTTMVTKSGNRLIDKYLIGAGGTLVGSILVDSAVENLKRKLPAKKKEESNNG